MPECVACGAELPEGSAFCNTCGAPQEPPATAVEGASDNVADSSDAFEPVPPEPKSHRGRWIAALLVAALVVAAGVGIYSQKRASDQAAAAAAAAFAKRRAEVATAKAEASTVLATVEKCESATQVGVTLNDLQGMAAEAVTSVSAFQRSDSAAIMPTFAAEIATTAQKYSESCNAWLTDNRAALAKYEKASDVWIYKKNGSGPAPRMESFQNDAAYQALWSEASTSLTLARAAFAKESAPPNRP